MGYTTVDNIAAMFPGFARNAAGSVQDTTIQLYVDGIAGDIDAVLQRRFSESITTAGSYAAWQAALQPGALNVLERINRAGGAGQMADALEVSQSPGFAVIAKNLGKDYDDLIAELNAETPTGKPKPGGGRYDALFDSLSAHPTARPLLGGYPGTGISPDGVSEDFAFHKTDDPGEDVDAGANADPSESLGESGE